MQPHPPLAPKPVVPWAASFARLSLSSKDELPLDLELEDLDDEDWSLPPLPGRDALRADSDRAPPVPADEPTPAIPGGADNR